MGFRWSLLVILLLVNCFACVALWRAVRVWVRREDRRRRVLLGMSGAVLLLNFPLTVFFIRRLDVALLGIPASVLKIAFYPSTAWLATIVAFFLLVGPPALIWAVAKLVARLIGKLRQSAPVASQMIVPAAASQRPALSRRDFVVGSAGLLIPTFYGVAAYGAYGALEELEVSPERSIPVPYLPASLDGMTIVQLSDLHVGPYIREKELRHLVSLVNGMRPDLVVITGDVIDRHLASLPEAVRGLTGMQSPLGTFAVLGNHDIFSDPYSYTAQHRGGVQIATALETIGIQTLRNQVIHLGSGGNRLALLGLDWLSLNLNPSSGSFFQYNEAATRQALARMDDQVEPGTPKVLLAHHPDTFADALPYEIGLTLAGHTHGGGQILLGHLNGMPIGISMLRFRYLSGLYQERGCSLYVNRGIGYWGVPIRINCPPEISRFRLARPATT